MPTDREGDDGVERRELEFEGAADVDEVIADHAQSNPAFYSGNPLVSAAVKTVSPLEYADSAFATGSPFLPLAEPATFLLSSALGTLGGVIGDGHPFHAHLLDFGFPLR